MPNRPPGKLVAPLALPGEFDDAIGRAETMWDAVHERDATRALLT